MAKKDEPNPPTDEDLKPGIELARKRLDLLDQRLDHIDSMVSAVVERIMKQPITINVTCSKCGQNIEIALIGAEKPRR
ncbi:hypothetical protein ACFLXZ_00550 [Chloroflexota bacterium]